MRTWDVSKNITELPDLGKHREEGGRTDKKEVDKLLIHEKS